MTEPRFVLTPERQEELRLAWNELHPDRQWDKDVWTFILENCSSLEVCGYRDGFILGIAQVEWHIKHYEDWRAIHMGAHEIQVVIHKREVAHLTTQLNDSQYLHNRTKEKLEKAESIINKLKEFKEKGEYGTFFLPKEIEDKLQGYQEPLPPTVTG